MPFNGQVEKSAHPGSAQQLEVFELSPNGNAGWNSTVLYTFPGAPAYYLSGGTLAFDNAGNLIGTVESANYNTYVYKLTYEKNGIWRVAYIWRKFHEGSPDPSGVVLDASGNVYSHTKDFVYELSAGTYQEKTLANIRFGADLILDSSGNLYKTSWVGGPHEAGAVFEVIP